MKVIAQIQGIAAVRVSFDEVAPPSNPPLMTVVSGIQNRFAFGVPPPAGSISMGGPLVFQTGKVIHEDKEIGLHQLLLLTDGDIVIASTTDHAKRGLDSLIEYLNGKFDYRLEGKSAKRYYASGVVVDFEKSITEMIGQLGIIQRMITQMIPTQTNDPFELLRFAFSPGTGQMPNPPITNPLDGVEKTDFLIERRAGASFSDNRFFCTAPCETERHIQILKEIERALLG